MSTGLSERTNIESPAFSERKVSDMSVALTNQARLMQLMKSVYQADQQLKLLDLQAEVENLLQQLQNLDRQRQTEGKEITSHDSTNN